MFLCKKKYVAFNLLSLLRTEKVILCGGEFLMGGFPRRDVRGTPTPSIKRRQKFSTNTNWLNLAGTFLATSHFPR
jgi:hypothetical protein